jgi:hypothetical protein
MHPEHTQFEHWLTCWYPHSSTRKHYMSDLVLFFSWAENLSGIPIRFTNTHRCHHPNP